MRKRFLPGLIKLKYQIVLVLLVALALCGCAKKEKAPSAPTGMSSTVASSEASIASTDATGSTVNTATTNNSASSSTDSTSVKADSTSTVLVEDAPYTSKDEVALYLHTYGHLPPNYITKKEAQSRGWDSSKGNLHKVAPGMSIGGDRFGNREGLLPDKKGRQYYECDIDYDGGSRNAKRIVYSDDGLVFYTEDHYASFEQLY